MHLLSAPLVTGPVTIFLIVMVIILLAPVLLNRLKIPHIVGMIVAGIIVGPFGLNILASDSSFAIFGQVGLLYLMFLAGLEIDMFHLRLNLRRGLGFGLLTFFIPMVMGVFASVYILNTGWLTAFLLASMYASHTLIAYPVAARFGVTKSPAVLISVVGTIIAVIGALLVLAACVNIHQTGEFQLSSMAWLVAKLALYCGAVLYAYPRISRWFFKSYSDRVTQYVFVLAMVFFSAWLSGAIGLEPVLGAFFAGLVLNRYIPANSALMSSIEFVGNALFIPYFLIGVGMMINVGVIVQGNTLWVASVMMLIALASKWLAAWVAQKLYGMAGADRRMMFGLTTAHTAVALAVVTIGYNMILPDGSRMMDETILNGTVLVILVTCAIAPLVTSAAAAKIKVRILNAMGPESVQEKAAETRQYRTLVGIANPITAASLVELAMLSRVNREGMYPDLMYALHVRNDTTPASRAMGRNSLRLAQEAAAAAGAQLDTIERYDLNTVTGLLNTIEERGINEVVLGMHRKGTVIDTFLGSKIEQLLRQTNRMVLVSRCYIPLNTLTRIAVFVPAKAEYETGFSRWVLTLCSLAREIGCRIIFSCDKPQQRLIRGVIASSGMGVRHEYRLLEGLDDFILLANRVLDDDLMVVVGARANSVSYSADMAEIPMILQQHCERNNLLVVYPEQFGDAPQLPSFTDPLQADLDAPVSGLWHSLRSRGRVTYRALRRRLKKRKSKH